MGFKKIPKRNLTMQKKKYFKYFQNEKKTFYGPAIIRDEKTLLFFTRDLHKLPIIRINNIRIYIYILSHIIILKNYSPTTFVGILIKKNSSNIIIYCHRAYKQNKIKTKTIILL